jgi:hypothetical protein
MELLPPFVDNDQMHALSKMKSNLNPLMHQDHLLGPDKPGLILNNFQEKVHVLEGKIGFLMDPRPDPSQFPPPIMVYLLRVNRDQTFRFLLFANDPCPWAKAIRREQSTRIPLFVAVGWTITGTHPVPNLIGPSLEMIDKMLAREQEKQAIAFLDFEPELLETEIEPSLPPPNVLFEMFASHSSSNHAPPVIPFSPGDN